MASQLWHKFASFMYRLRSEIQLYVCQDDGLAVIALNAALFTKLDFNRSLKDISSGQRKPTGERMKRSKCGQSFDTETIFYTQPLIPKVLCKSNGMLRYIALETPSCR